MYPSDLISRKRDGQALSRDEITFIVNGYLRESLSADDFLAFLTASWQHELSAEETHAIASALVLPEEAIAWPGISYKKIGRRSTGGVGDNTSLMIPSIVAAGGVAMPLFANRGLGYIGGTLDKLESIADFRVAVPREELLQLLQRYDGFLASQSNHLAPAQKKLEALSTMEAVSKNPALLCLALMSKELAAGVDGTLIDVKASTGALLRNIEDARKAAQWMVNLGESAGKRVVAFITDMDQPIGRTIGNALEIGECVDLLREQRDPRSEDVRELSIQMAGWIFFMAERTPNLEEGRRLALELLIKGKASAQFRKMIIAQGGDAVFWLDQKHLKIAEKHHEIKSTADGYLTAVDCYKIGLAAQVIGAGRATVDDKIDATVGIELLKKTDDAVSKGDVLVRLYYNDEDRLRQACDYLENSFTILPERGKIQPLVHAIISSKNIPKETFRSRGQ